MKPRQTRRNQLQDFRRDFVFGKIDEVSSKRVGNDLVKSALIDKAAVDQGLFDILAVQVRLVQDVIGL